MGEPLKANPEMVDPATVTVTPIPLDLDVDWSEINRREAEYEARLAGRYDAEDICEYLEERVKKFQSSLSEDKELGLKLANFGEASQINIRSIGYKNPNLIEFNGINSDGHEVTLIQHVSQLSFQIIAVKPIEDKPYRIGY